MAQSRDNRIMALVRACSDMDADERQAFLEGECQSEPSLRDEVLLLLDEDADKTGAQALKHPLADSLPPHYKLIGLLGSGGMAEVFLAEDSRLGRRVAIKFLNDTFRRDPERMRRFKQEARAASALNHPNIITIHDIGESDGVQYIVSEFVEGETLGRRIERGKIPVPEAVEIAIQIASALETAHKAGIVHRDLKPDNIMLRTDGSVKVVDFGIAKGSPLSGVADTAEETALSTSPGLILGTPKYMSPEQTRGLPLDQRSDIFSFGIVLFEMLTGHSPFGGSNVVDAIAGIIGKAPREISAYSPETPAELERAVYKALEKRPEHRHASAKELVAELQDVRSGLTFDSQQQRRGLETRKARPDRLRRLSPWFAVLLAVAVIGVGGWLIFGRGKLGPPGGTLRTVPVTSWNSASAEPVSAAAFSPDAKMVAFASTRTGATEIWVKPTTGGEPIQVTRTGFYNQFPIWSPDAQEIAFFSSRGETRGIWRVSFTGGQESQLLSGVGASARPVRWTKEGKIILQDGGELFTVDIATADRKQLTDLKSAGIEAGAMSISSDLSTVAFAVKDDKGWTIRRRQVAGDSSADVASSKTRISSIAFDPAGGSIVYSAENDGVMQIFRITPGDKEPTQLSTGTSDLFLQDVSADGTKFLYSSINETSDLWAADTETGKERVIVNDVAEEYWPDVSPDGRAVVYQSVTQADRPFRGSIFVASLADADPPRLLSPEGFTPTWSPDGRWIAYFRRMGNTIAIWKVRPNGADAMKLAEGDISTTDYTTVPYLRIGPGTMAWSPDGGSILYLAVAEGRSDLWTVSADGGEPRRITENPDAVETFKSVVWAGSNTILISSLVAATATRARAFKLYTVPAGGGERSEVYHSPSPFGLIGLAGAATEAVIAQRSDPKDQSLLPVSAQVSLVPLSGKANRGLNTLANAYFHNIQLSKDGRTLCYVTRVNNATEAWTISTAGGAPKKLMIENDPKVLISEVVWSPDGRSVIFGKQTRTNILSMLTN